MARTLLIVFLLLVAGFIGFELADITHNEREKASASVDQITPRFRHATPRKNEQEEDPDQQPPLHVTALELYAAYHRNEVSADQYYKGQILEVDGQVEEIGKNFAGDVYLALGTTNEFETVDAYIQSSSVSYAATLSPGTVVTVLCRGDGMIVGSPVLRDCSIK